MNKMSRALKSQPRMAAASTSIQNSKKVPLPGADRLKPHQRLPTVNLHVGRPDQDPLVAGVDTALQADVLQGFDGRPTVGLNEAAKILRMHVKTLRLHITDGNLDFLQIGTGVDRPRRIFTPTLLLEFYARQRQRVAARD